MTNKTRQKQYFATLHTTNSSVSCTVLKMNVKVCLMDMFVHAHRQPKAVTGDSKKK